MVRSPISAATTDSLELLQPEEHGVLFVMHSYPGPRRWDPDGAGASPLRWLASNLSLFWANYFIGWRTNA